ncbi:MAG: hypothetical protein ACK2UO_22430 [Caldilineaceae bacterium]|jgi:hypothetical protein
MIKVVISYDMQEGREQDCQEYLVNKLAPGLARLGFQVSDVWYTVWGQSPQITSGGEVEDLAKARGIFLSSDWERLAEGMEELTSNFQVRLTRSIN